MASVGLFLIIVTLFKITTADAVTDNAELPKNRTRRFSGGIAVAFEPRISTVSLEYYGKHMCAGSIITDRLILTAASCLVQKWFKKLTVRVGSTRIGTKGALYRVEKTSVHPQFILLFQINDVALLWLNQSIDYQRINAEPVDLFDESDRTILGSKGFLHGWDLIYAKQRVLNGELATIPVKLVPIEKCARFMEKGSRQSLIDKICATSIGEICSRDVVGSPLIVGGLQAGIAITKPNCSLPGSPVLYMQIDHIRGWISKEILALPNLERPPVVFHPLSTQEIDANRDLQGTSINFKDASFLVSIITTVGNILTCTGTIIGTDHVLTSTRCASAGLATFYVRSGSGNWTHGGKRHRIVDTKWHSSYKIKKLKQSWHDVAILQVEPPFVFDKRTRMVELFGKGEETVQGSLASVYGWDSKADKIRRTNRRPIKNLQSLNLRVISSDECTGLSKSQGDISEAGQICAFNKMGMCIGQLGAPLMIGNKQAGVYVWGNEECADYRFPSVFTEVAKYKEWIDALTNYKYIKNDELR